MMILLNVADTYSRSPENCISTLWDSSSVYDIYACGAHMMPEFYDALFAPAMLERSGMGVYYQSTQ